MMCYKSSVTSHPHDSVYRKIFQGNQGKERPDALIVLEKF